MAVQRGVRIFDGLLTGPPSPILVDRLLRTGYYGVNWTVADHADSLESALHNIATFYWLCDAAPDRVKIVSSATDLNDVEDGGRLRIVMGFQGAEPLGKSFHFLSIFHALGLRILQLTYNDANYVGSGCLEPDDHGLTHFGIQVIREMNRLGMLVDVTHAGVKTSLDAIATSASPVVFSHSNARSVRNNPRNLTDEQMCAVAERGGVIGIATFADFVADTTKGQPTLDQFLDHIRYVVDLVGIDHVAIGTDIMNTADTAGIWWNANTKRRYPELCGAMDEHMHGIDGFEVWDDFGRVVEGLGHRGFNDQAIEKIIGGNFLRVLRSVLK